MSKAADPSKILTQLLKTLKSKHGDPAPHALPEPPVDADPLLHQLVYSFMLWETTANQALTAHKRLLASVVDYNELRICLPDDIVDMLGDRFALVRERAVRMRAALNDIYEREHALSLEHLQQAGKREARSYLESLEGCPRFVSARVTLLELGGHAAPVDDRLHTLMIKQGLLAEDSTLDDAVNFLERKLRAADGVAPFLLLESWRESAGASPRKRDAGALAFSRAETTAALTPRPTARKTTTRKSATRKRS